MAEVLSLAASIIAVLGVAEGAAKTVSKVASIRNAPDQILALVNEISDLRVVLYNTESYVRTAQEPQIAQEHLQQLSTFVDRAKAKLLELEKLIHHTILKPQSSPERIVISKFEWTRAVQKVYQFQQNLQDIRLNIVTQMTMINS